MKYAVVVPTYSRPDEVNELLVSLLNQDYRDFEVIIADGSPDNTVKEVVELYNSRLNLIYLYKKNLGISESRNWGADKATGDYLVFFDSDCVIPSGYFSVLNTYFLTHELDVWGGPDKAGSSFNNRQKAISYAMTSFYTTGGIRGKKNHVGQYQPRSFNMGISRDVFLRIGGFSGMKVSEDIDLSLRLYKEGYKIGLIEDAFVYHKRRSTFYKFFRQVNSFGSGRIDLQLKHGDALKPVHLLPSLFVLYLIGGLIASIFSKGVFMLWAGSVLAYMIAIFVDATIQNRNPVVGLLSVYAAFVMLAGYGLGMIKAFIMRFVLKSRKESDKPAITREA
jgi:glycosyltransferase involved in cell wall biosynthesis